MTYVFVLYWDHNMHSKYMRKTACKKNILRIDCPFPEIHRFLNCDSHVFFKKIMNTKKRKMHAEMCVAFRKVRKLESFSHVFVQIYCPSRPSQRKWELYYLDQSPLWNCFKWLLFADLTSILKACSTIQINFFPLLWRCLLRVFSVVLCSFLFMGEHFGKILFWCGYEE